MKITKSRLLQIIREEVEFHEQNNFELDEEELSQLTDKEEKQAIEDEIASDEEMGNLDEFNVELEDMILTKKKPHKVIEPLKKQNDI
jgi:hypothetical protein